MIDTTELKRLAEAFPSDLDWDSNTEPFFNGPSGESLGGGSTGFYCVYGAPFTIDDDQYDGPTYVEACKADFAKFMVAARDGVLFLIAENDRLKREEKNDAIAYKAAIERQEELRIERDQLREEIDLDNKIIAERERLLSAIPECGPNGKCVPHAIEWVEKTKSDNEVLSDLLKRSYKFVAFAFDQGLEGAEDVGRDMDRFMSKEARS